MRLIREMSVLCFDKKRRYLRNIIKIRKVFRRDPSLRSIDVSQKLDFACGRMTRRGEA